QRRAEEHGTVGDWEAIMCQSEAALTPENRARLADDLGLPEHSLHHFRTGYGHDQHGAHWRIAATDPTAKSVGISSRYQKGEKRAMAGGKRGLVTPRNFGRHEGPVLLPEGFSDTATLTALGLAAVGRPSNTGGVEYLVELLRSLPADRDI